MGKVTTPRYDGPRSASQCPGLLMITLHGDAGHRPGWAGCRHDGATASHHRPLTVPDTLGTVHPCRPAWPACAPFGRLLAGQPVWASRCRVRRPGRAPACRVAGFAPDRIVRAKGSAAD
ncbi:hypothetical protein I553_4325 [Mycobacterium xenopi 4042]|uniref:Uncharacterized protein n=1 Tax=Mycobacterium xenopi 4042 TaxID=1299334 RepID=X8AEW2_MYCXE|nr:hypothetical protein I553_4325 [Mycobacterium xenopi 4042]